MHVIQSQNAFYLVPLCDAAYVRKKTDQHISPSECCNDDSVFVSRSKQLFGWSMYNRRKGHRQNMAVTLGFHPNQMQNNAVNSGHLLTSGTSFPIAFVFLFILLSFACLTLPNTSLSHPVLSTCPFLRGLTIYAKWLFLITHKYPSHS